MTVVDVTTYPDYPRLCRRVNALEDLAGALIERLALAEPSIQPALTPAARARLDARFAAALDALAATHHTEGGTP